MKKTLIPAVLVLACLLGCSNERETLCHDTYRHMLDLAQRNHRPEILDEFMELCLVQFDPKRLQCIREAKTAEAALGCRAQKKRPD